MGRILGLGPLLSGGGGMTIKLPAAVIAALFLSPAPPVLAAPADPAGAMPKVMRMAMAPMPSVYAGEAD